MASGGVDSGRPDFDALQKMYSDIGKVLKKDTGDLISRKEIDQVIVRVVKGNLTVMKKGLFARLGIFNKKSIDKEAAKKIEELFKGAKELDLSTVGSGELKKFEKLADLTQRIVNKKQTEVFLEAKPAKHLTKLTKAAATAANEISEKAKGAQLCNACSTADIETIRSLATKESVNYKDINGLSPLHLACINGDVEVVKILLEVDGIDVNIQSKNRLTPLHIAYSNGNLEVIKALNVKGAVEPKDDEFKENKNATFVKACEENNLSYVEQAIKLLGNDKEAVLNSTLLLACQKDNPHQEIINLLLDNGANITKDVVEKLINVVGAEKIGNLIGSALCDAIKEGHLVNVTNLLECAKTHQGLLKIIQEFQNNDGTLLQLALAEKDMKIFEALRDAGVEISDRTVDSINNFLLAQENPSMIEGLLKSLKGSLNIISKQSIAHISQILGRYNIELISSSANDVKKFLDIFKENKELLSAVVNYKHQMFDSKTALQFACESQDPDKTLIRTLLECGANITEEVADKLITVIGEEEFSKFVGSALCKFITDEPNIYKFRNLLSLANKRDAVFEKIKEFKNDEGKALLQLAFEYHHTNFFEELRKNGFKITPNVADCINNFLRTTNANSMTIESKLQALKGSLDILTDEAIEHIKNTLGDSFSGWCVDDVHHSAKLLGLYGENKKLLSAVVNYKDSNGETPLTVAINKHTSSFLTGQLLEHGARIDSNTLSSLFKKDAKEAVRLLKENYLKNAIKNEDITAFTFLIDHAKKYPALKEVLDTAKGSKTVTNLLRSACSVGTEKDFKELNLYFAGNARNDKMLLRLAIENNKGPDFVNTLISSGAPFDESLLEELEAQIASDDRPENDKIYELLASSYLINALFKDDVKAVSRFANNTKILNLKFYGEPLLNRAIDAGKINFAKALINAGADVNCKDIKNITPLSCALAKGNIELANTLISKGADLKLIFSENIKSNPNLLKSIDLLIDTNGIDAQYGENKDTLLHMTLNTRNTDIFKHIIKKKPNPIILNSKSETALYYAYLLNAATFSLLAKNLPSSVDVNTKDANGNTPLMLATYVTFDLLRAQKLELDKTKDRNEKQLTKLNKQLNKQLDKIYRRLDTMLKNYAQIDIENNSGITPLKFIIAMEFDSEEATKIKRLFSNRSRAMNNSIT